MPLLHEFLALSYLMKLNLRTRKIAFSFAFVFVTTLVSAQSMKVQGTVLDEKNLPVIGATVLIKNTDTGTITDVDGKYTINAKVNDVLVISYVGYLAQELTVVSGTDVYDAQLSNNFALDEVIVVGYGTQNKRDVTGSVVSLSETTLKEVPAPNMLNQLKGRAAGVSIVSNGTGPGAQGQIRIRGNRTLTTDNGDGLDGPLVVVDGIPYGGLNDINPDDIASMEILKDASSTAIFGSRGAGGVVLITTKRGRVSKPVLTYDAYHGVTNIMGKYDFMNAAEYVTHKDWATKLNSATPNSTAYPLTPVETANLAAGVDTDWQDLMFRQGFNTSHQLGVQGGGWWIKLHELILSVYPV